jgi:hypothetical protein
MLCERLADRLTLRIALCLLIQGICNLFSTHTQRYMHNKVANHVQAAALHASVPVNTLITHNHGDAHRLAER